MLATARPWRHFVLAATALYNSVMFQPPLLCFHLAVAALRFSGRCAALPSRSWVLAAGSWSLHDCGCTSFQRPLRGFAKPQPRFSGRGISQRGRGCTAFQRPLRGAGALWLSTSQQFSSRHGRGCTAAAKKKLRFPSASFLSFSQAFPIKRSPSFFTPFSQAFPSKRSPSFFTPFFELLQFFVGHLFPSLSLFKGPTVAGPFLFILVSLEVLLLFLDLDFLNFLMCLLLFEHLFFLQTHYLLV